MLVDVGTLVVGLGLSVALPEGLPFLAWGIAGAFTGAASSGAMNVFLTLPKNWTSEGFWISMGFGAFMGAISGGFTGEWVGKEDPITGSKLEAAGFDEATGSFAASDDQATSTWAKTKAVGKQIYQARMEKRRWGYFYGYAIQGLAVSSNLVHAKHQDAAVFKSIGEYFLYPAAGLIMAYPSTRLSSLGAAAGKVYGTRAKRSFGRLFEEAEPGERMPLLGLVADL